MAYVDELERRMCTGKVRYNDFDRAEAVALHMTKEHRGEAFRVYRCAFCQLLHVGHSNRQPITLKLNRYDP